MSNFEWTCAHCDRVQTAGNPNSFEIHEHIRFGEPIEGPLGYTVLALRCLSSPCQRTTFNIFIHQDTFLSNGSWKPEFDKSVFSERLMPRGASKPQPDYIPAPIREDYLEACLIRDLSPKASATLSRRCLQGMIRDFAGISKGTLDAEIKALLAGVEDNTAPRAITIESVQAIDHVRKVGNIGAHMEKDINVILDVDAGEAQALIDLVELLLREWYVDRYQRQERLKAVEAIRLHKDQLKLEGQMPQTMLPTK